VHLRFNCLFKTKMEAKPLPQLCKLSSVISVWKRRIWGSWYKPKRSRCYGSILKPREKNMVKYIFELITF